MWKVLFFLVFVASLTFVYCDVIKPTYKCRVNEVFSNCTNGGCDARNCSQAGKPVPCVKLDPKSCIKGCVCKSGYLRAANRTCVPKNQCNEGCGNDPNAHPGCGVNCGRTCSTYKTKYVACILSCKENGCDCNDGYVLDTNINKCVSPKKCTPTCGRHEIYSSCINGGCGYRNCSQLGQPELCIDPLPEYCIKGCICASGYLRAKNGTCIPRNQCPTSEKCGPNERFVVCPDTMCIPRNCSQRGLPVPCPILGPEGRCPGKPACICVENYLRDDTTGECVPSKKCKPPTTTTTTEAPDKPSCGCGGYPLRCGKNEVYNNCSDPSCRPLLCSELGFPLKCDKKCKPGCICKDGYVRNSKGVCILIKNCPSCGGDENAESGCGNNCGRTCATYKNKNTVCTLSCILNGCNCRDGLVYDPNVKKCVKPIDCTPTCKVNEEYTPCINGGCGPKNCSQIGQPNICIDPVTCVKGCVCVNGYLRASNGTCVPKDKCPRYPPRCAKNEVYNNCSDPSCRPLLCSELGFPLKCDKKCKPGCICKDGYVRNSKGVCILIKNCPSCGGDENAESGCGNNCGRTCATYKNKNTVCTLSCILNGCNCRDGLVYDPNVKKCVKPIDCTPTCKVNEEYTPCINGGCGPKNCSQIGQPNICIDPVTCVKGCVCVNGYLRASNGTCVPKDKCPRYPPRCAKNEVYNNCSDPSCRPLLCSELGFPLKCDKKCKPGCICKDGYVRNSKGVCILIKNCPSCGGDENAESGCGNNCGRTCATYKNKNTVCTLSCILNGCNCRDGLVYDPNVKKCVKPIDCTPTCKVNEEYTPCINGGCGPKNCSQIGQPNICIDPVTCVKGCVCVNGYLRASNGTCVPKDKCPPPVCPAGEVWSTCPTVKCVGDNCPKTRDSPQTCPVGIVCDPPRCVCGYNRKRDKTGKCILITDCPPFKCGVNEEYQACPSSCPGEKCSDYINKTKCPIFRIGIIVNCRPQCKCIKGYYRDKGGKCVAACDCPADSPVENPLTPSIDTEHE